MIKGSMTKGVDDSCYFIVLVTQKYMEKVNDPSRKENCYIEFEYAQRRKGFSQFIIIVRDASMTNPRNWTGVFGTCGGELFIDAVGKSAGEVCDQVITRLRQTVILCFISLY